MKRFGMRAGAAALALAAGLGLAAQAQAGEVFLGGYAHGIGTKQAEDGFDTMVGYRTAKIDSLWYLGKPSVHFIGSVNSEVRTDFVAAGFKLAAAHLPGQALLHPTRHRHRLHQREADIGNAFEPGISAAEKARRQRLTATRIDFGSNAVFEPELALGYHFTPKLSAELSFVHLSNGQILHQGKNQGMDDVGARITYRFGGPR